MAIRCNYLVMCEHVVIARDNKASLIDIVNNVGLQSLPGVLFAWVMASVSGNAGESFRLVIDGPDGSRIVDSDPQTIDETPVDSPPEAIMATTGGMKLSPVIFNTVGLYRLVLLDGQSNEVSSLPFSVFLRPSNGGD